MVDFFPFVLLFLALSLQRGFPGSAQQISFALFISSLTTTARSISIFYLRSLETIVRAT
jgi:hypothetical protein